MGHTEVSATQASLFTLYIWQHGAKENYSKIETFNMSVILFTLGNERFLLVPFLATFTEIASNSAYETFSLYK